MLADQLYADQLIELVHMAPGSAGDVPAASWVQVPRDIGALRLTDPEQARGWRAKVRDQLTTAQDVGGNVAGFDKERGYLVLPHEGDLP